MFLQIGLIDNYFKFNNLSLFKICFKVKGAYIGMLDIFVKISIPGDKEF